MLKNLLLSTLLLGLVVLPSGLAQCILDGSAVKCTGNVTVEDMVTFFKQDFNTTQLNEFSLNVAATAPKPILLTDVFNGVSFNFIHITGEGMIEGIANNAFIGSQETLKLILIEKASPLTTFNLSMVATPTTISVNLKQDSLKNAPAIDCNNKAPHDFVYEIHNNEIEVIPSGFWKYCDSAMAAFTLTDSVKSIEKDAFYVGGRDSTTFCISTKNSSLTSIAPGFINADELKPNQKITITLDFMKNKLSALPKNVFQEYFDTPNMDMDIYIQDNPIACNCDFAWIVRNPMYFRRLLVVGSNRARCADGREIHSLTAQDFSFCPTP